MYTYSVDPDERHHYAAFHLGLPCLQKYSFRGFPNTQGYKAITCIGRVVAPKCFNHGILQMNFKKFTMKWSFPYNSFVKLSLPTYNMICL